jgi:hypothetical protein
MSDIRVAAPAGLALMPVFRHLISPADELDVGALPGDPENLAQPGQGIISARIRLRLGQQLAAHSGTSSRPGCGLPSPDRRFSRRKEISARASRACSAPSLVSW